MVAGKTNWTSLVLGTGTLAVILLLKRSKRLPGALIAVVVAAVVTVHIDYVTDSGSKAKLVQGLVFNKSSDGTFKSHQS